MILAGILAATSVLVIICALIAGVIALVKHGNPNITHAINVNIVGAPGPHFANINPYITGRPVYVMENGVPSDMDWYGTYLGKADNGMVLVRDTATLITAHVNRDQVFGYTI